MLTPSVVDGEVRGHVEIPVAQAINFVHCDIPESLTIEDYKAQRRTRTRDREAKCRSVSFLPRVARAVQFG
jgi:hypothetical protein